MYGCLSGSDLQSAALKPLLGGSASPGRNHVVGCRGVNRRVQEDVKEDTFLIRVEVPAVTMIDKDAHVKVNLKGHASLRQPIKLFLQQERFWLCTEELWRLFQDFS